VIVLAVCSGFSFEPRPERPLILWLQLWLNSYFEQRWLADIFIVYMSMIPL
jgi:hypothetical protein